MSNRRNRSYRRAAQALICREVLSRHLPQGELLESLLKDLNLTMRTGEHSWAFKATEVEPPDDRVYYTTGGNS